MCSFFTQRIMAGNDHGDLADIVGGGGLGFSGGAANSSHGLTSYHETSSPGSFDEFLEDFGNPFANTKDPLLHHELGVVQVGTAAAFNRTPSSGGGQSLLPSKEYVDQDHMKKIRPVPSNIFSRMLQISPSSSHGSSVPTAAIPPASSSISTSSPPAINAFRSDTMDAIIKGNSNSMGCSSMNQDAGAGHEVQIPTPRNPGIKRRKSQAKKVVCIPAPAAATSRPTGEVVPSDLWAWRKYGQKPIKGSPYPRGYYRCSSSKGCSARKQVERSRTDPNMLVITYTSEHNHPWPTQRNALAGSTRSQPSKSNSSNFKNTSAKHSCGVDVKEEQKETLNHERNAKAVVPSDHSKLSVKDEVNLGEDEMKPCLEMNNQDFDQVFHNTYTPLSLQGSDHQTHDDFFADLDEFDQNPFSLISSHDHGYPTNQSSQSAKEEKGKDSKASIDPFMDIFDWPSTG